jgi:hypothetical protein
MDNSDNSVVAILDRLSKSDRVSAEEKAALASAIDRKQRLLPGWDDKFLALIPDVQTVIDVGVLYGTPELYKAFPSAYLILIEALPPYERYCSKILARRQGGGEYHLVAAGDENGIVQIRHYIDHPMVSSILQPIRDRGDL